MRNFPQGVTVVTYSSESGFEGVTVSSFTSISLEPPLILISLAKGTKSNMLLSLQDYFAVNLLAEDQKSVSDRFAGRDDIEERFRGIKYSLTSRKLPIIAGSVAYLECRKYRWEDAGDHDIVLGEVLDGAVLNSKMPLVYHRQQYTLLSEPWSREEPFELFW
jgi:flavin reductase (DIM6/NTAB) family NADH-FMN oxidoreductase RutF